jgi:hypothetical protein
MAQYAGSTRLGASLPENKTQLASELLCLFNKSDEGQSPKKEEYVN